MSPAHGLFVACFFGLISIFLATPSHQVSAAALWSHANNYERGAWGGNGGWWGGGHSDWYGDSGYDEWPRTQGYYGGRSMYACYPSRCYYKPCARCALRCYRYYDDDYVNGGALYFTFK
jgi:hypothetical protein